MSTLIGCETHDWLAQVYQALVRNDHMMMVWEDTENCGIVVAPAEGESYQHFLAHSFRNALKFVEAGCVSIQCTPRCNRDLGIELAELLGEEDGSATDWTLVEHEDV